MIARITPLLTPLFLAIAFLFLLLVNISVPVTKTIYLFRLNVAASSSLFHSGVSASLVAGMWGYCTSGIDASVLGISKNTAAECSKQHLGYTLDSGVANALHISNFENFISKTLTGALALHLVAAVLTFVTLLISLFALHRGSNGTSRLPSLLALGPGVLAAILTTIAFLIDAILVGTVKSHVHKDTDGTVTLNWGNAVWLTLVAAILLWIANVGSLAGICGCNKRRT
ncbi:pali-domain-containing protein [Mycena polygramma]|nr:pali-domain-containing protein [Mycena polygramma]